MQEQEEREAQKEFRRKDNQRLKELFTGGRAETQSTRGGRGGSGNQEAKPDDGQRLASASQVEQAHYDAAKAEHEAGKPRASQAKKDAAVQARNAANQAHVSHADAYNTLEAYDAAERGTQRHNAEVMAAPVRQPRATKPKPTTGASPAPSAPATQAASTPASPKPRGRSRVKEALKPTATPQVDIPPPVQTDLRPFDVPSAPKPSRPAPRTTTVTTGGTSFNVTDKRHPRETPGTLKPEAKPGPKVTDKRHSALGGQFTRLDQAA